MDLNAAVTSHVAKLAARAAQGRPYKLQLPRDVGAHWTKEAVNYWQHFGEVVGTPVTPLPVPPQLASVSLRAVAVTPERAARLIAGLEHCGADRRFRRWRKIGPGGRDK